MVLTRAKAAQAAAAAARLERASNIAAAQRSNSQAAPSISNDDAWSVIAVKGHGSRSEAGHFEKSVTIIIAPKQSRNSVAGASSSDPIVIDDNVENANSTPLTPFEQYLRNEFVVSHSTGLPKPQRSPVELARDRNRMDNGRRREHKMMLRSTQETEKTAPAPRSVITAVPETPSPTTPKRTSQTEAEKALEATLDEILDEPQAEVAVIPQTKIQDVPHVATPIVPNVPHAAALNIPQAESGIFKMHESRLRALPDMSSSITGGGLLQLSMGSAPDYVTTAVPKKVTGANDIAMGPSRFTSFRRVSAQSSGETTASLPHPSAPPANNPMLTSQPLNTGPAATVPKTRPARSMTKVMEAVDTLQAILGRKFMNRRFLFQAAPAISTGKMNPNAQRPTDRKFSQLGEAAHKLAFFEKHNDKSHYRVQQLYNAKRMIFNITKVAEQTGLVAFARPNASDKITAKLVLALIGAAHLDGGLGAAVGVMEKLNLL